MSLCQLCSSPCNVWGMHVMFQKIDQSLSMGAYRRVFLLIYACWEWLAVLISFLFPPVITENWKRSNFLMLHISKRTHSMNKAKHDIHTIIFPTVSSEVNKHICSYVYSNAELCPFIQIDWKNCYHFQRYFIVYIFFVSVMSIIAELFPYFWMLKSQFSEILPSVHYSLIVPC
jgi:hypothetical protein